MDLRRSPRRGSVRPGGDAVPTPAVYMHDTNLLNLSNKNGVWFVRVPLPSHESLKTQPMKGQRGVTGVTRNV